MDKYQTALSGVATQGLLQHRLISSLRRSSLQHHIAITAVGINRGICHSKSLVGHSAALAKISAHRCPLPKRLF